MTVEQVIAAALVRNRKTQPNIQVIVPELLGHYNRAISGLFSVAARVNPSYFGVISSPVAIDGGTFPRPAGAELIYRIETTDGDRVWILDAGDRTAEPSRPGLYPWGRRFRPANALGEGLASVVFFYSRTPTLASAGSDNVDVEFPASHYDLLVLELAIYIAQKDQRYDEVQVLRVERDSWLTLFVAHLEHDVLGRTRVAGQTNRFDGPSIVSLQSILAGGASAA